METAFGRIVMSPPAKWPQGWLDSRLNPRIARDFEEIGLGVTLGRSTCVDLFSGDTLQPDFAFISRARREAGPVPAPDANGFLAIVPDLAVEIPSRSSRQRDRSEKREIYAENGGVEYWLVDPERREVTVFHRERLRFARPVDVSSGEVPSRVLPDLCLTIEDLFAGVP